MITLATAALLVSLLGAADDRLLPSPNQPPQSPPDVKSVIRQSDELLRVYRETGKTEAAKARLLAYFLECDARFGKDPDYLLAKADVLQAIGEHELWRVVFEQVPDEALVTPLHLANRISLSYWTRPAAAVALVRKLAADASPRAQSALLDWVHCSLAQQYAPEIKKTVGSQLDPLLDGLCSPDQPALCAISSGLRTWVRAQRAAADSNALRALLRAEFGGSGSYAPRYRLLLAGLAERDPVLREDAFALRESVIAELLPATEAREIQASRQENRAVKRYWLAFAFNAQAAAAFGRGDDDTGMRYLRSAAEWSPDKQDVLANGFFYERVTLGGRAEYRSGLAERLERDGRWEDALTVRTELARLEPKELPALRRLHDLARPNEAFDRYWAQERLRDAPRAPDFSLRSLTGATVTLSSYRGQWVMVDYWGTWCEPCVKDVPTTERLHRKLLDSSANAAILTIAVEDTRERVRAFMRARHLTFTVLLGNDEVVKNYKVPHYPYRILVSPDGRYIELANGPGWVTQAESVPLPSLKGASGYR